MKQNKYCMKSVESYVKSQEQNESNIDLKNKQLIN